MACSLEKSWKKSTHFAFCGSLDSICPAKCLDSSPDGEMVDAEDSKSSSSGVRVQVPLGAPIKQQNVKTFSFAIKIRRSIVLSHFTIRASASRIFLYNFTHSLVVLDGPVFVPTTTTPTLALCDTVSLGLLHTGNK